MDLKLVAFYLLSEMHNQKKSYADLKKITGIPKASLQRYMTGEKDVPLIKYDLVCKALSVDPAKLLGWKQDNPETDNLDKEILSIVSTFDTSEKTILVQFLKSFAAHEEKK